MAGAGSRPVQFSIPTSELPAGEFSVNGRGDIRLRKTVDFETRQNYR